MSSYAAFLRGINVGGHRIKSEELRSLFEQLGFTDVATFRASGNVVFTAKQEHVDKLTLRIEAQLESSLGYAAATFLRTAKQVRTIADLDPFDVKLVEASAGKLQVTMLSAAPSASARKSVLRLATEQDRLAFGASELYWLPSGGILDSKLDLKAIGKLLGAGTTRTKGTVEQIAQKYFSTA
jgi:uncharacterized protein (DUF1697 family)